MARRSRERNRRKGFRRKNRAHPLRRVTADQKAPGRTACGMEEKPIRAPSVGPRSIVRTTKFGRRGGGRLLVRTGFRRLSRARGRGALTAACPPAKSPRVRPSTGGDGSGFAFGFVQKTRENNNNSYGAREGSHTPTVLGNGSRQQTYDGECEIRKLRALSCTVGPDDFSFSIRIKQQTRTL